MADVKIKIVKLNARAIFPEYQTAQSAGMDLCACLDEPLTIKPMERLLVPTGLAVELPIGYEMQVRARSGMSLKHGLTMVNGIGTVDSDYRGELCAPMINLSAEPFTIEHGMRIAQAVIARHEHAVLEKVEILSETDRGAGGFGSTGK